MSTFERSEAAVIDNEELFFANESEMEPKLGRPDTWKLVIADDEEEVHALTRMVLAGFSFEGRGLEFLSAYSGEEAKELLARNPDTAVVLLDVVMERDDAGLAVVRHIREDLHNRISRIILRTGHPGQAPEHEVISNYDINDYKSKTELTAQKLYTSVTAALRSYRDIQTIEKSRRGLETIIGATGDLFGMQALERFSAGVLRQMAELVRVGSDGPTLMPCGFTATRRGGEFRILAGSGRFEAKLGEAIRTVIDEDVRTDLLRVLDDRCSRFEGDRFFGYFAARGSVENLVYMECGREATDLDRDMMSILSANVGIAYDNIYLNREIEDTQKEVIHTLGEVVETRSQETAHHTVRVGESSGLLARLAGLGEEEAKLLQLAAPMHDVGKIGIPDEILNKPGKLSPREYEQMKTHTSLGHDILRKSNRRIMTAAATIALQHHEKWDGSGYPAGLAGDDIHVHGRIVCICDVFDALSNQRVYRDMVALDHVIEIMRLERGKHFDPGMLDIFLENVDKFVAIQNRHSTESGS